MTRIAERDSNEINGMTPLDFNPLGTTEDVLDTFLLQAIGLNWNYLDGINPGDLHNNLSEYFDNISAANRWTNGSLDTTRNGFQYSTWQIIVLATLAGLTSVVTIGGNLIVLLSFIVERTIRQPTNYFIASLAVSDLLIGSVSMPFYTVYLLAGQRWPLGEILCDLWLSVDYTVCLCSIYTVFCITIDRFCSVKIPARYRDWRSENKVLVMIAVTWAVPVLVFFTSIFGWQYFVGRRTVPDGKCYVQYMEAALFNCLLQVGYFWITLTVMCALYTGIYQVVLNLSRKSEAKQRKVTTMVKMVGSSGISRQPTPNLNEDSATSDEQQEPPGGTRNGKMQREGYYSSKSPIPASDSVTKSKNSKKCKQKPALCPQLSNGDRRRGRNRSLKSLGGHKKNEDSDLGMVKVQIGVVVSEPSDNLPLPETRLISNDPAASIQRYDAININEASRSTLSTTHCESKSSQSTPALDTTDTCDTSGSSPAWSSCKQTLQVPGQMPKSSDSQEELVPRLSRESNSTSDLLTVNRCSGSRRNSTVSDSIPNRRGSRSMVPANFKWTNRQSFKVRTAKERHSSNSSENRARKALRTITVILGAFVLCWTPWHVLSMIISFCPTDRVCVEPMLYDVSYWLCYLNSPINPLCYALANQQFKKTFIRIMKFDFHRT